MSDEELLQTLKNLLASIKYGQYSEREKIVNLFTNLLLERKNLHTEVTALEEELLYKEEK